ncbi:MAG: response regulator [Lachnospiraceae bacterium]|nr:response regulator [Lachnospiraceae bacterium]
MSELSSNTKKRILIVDDDQEILDIYRLYLEPTYIVATVSHGQFAIDYVNEYRTDLILLDVVMPVMDGFQTLQALRSTPEGAKIPVIFVTGKSSRNIVLESISVGVDGYLLKPIVKDQLLSKVNEMLVRQSSVSSRKTILAIDDDVTYLRILSNMLKDSYNVVMINSVKLAMDYLSSFTPDIILMDYQMPLNSSNTLLGYIKNMTSLDNVPVIMLVGIKDKNIVVDNLVKQPDSYLLKPVSKMDITRTIVSVLRNKQK